MCSSYGGWEAGFLGVWRLGRCGDDYGDDSVRLSQTVSCTQYSRCDGPAGCDDCDEDLEASGDAGWVYMRRLGREENGLVCAREVLTTQGIHGTVLRPGGRKASFGF